MTERTYEDFLGQMGDLMKRAMPATDHDRDALEESEAEVHRLKMQLAVAEERREVLAERYRRSRGVFMEMWNTWKAEVLEQRPATASAVGTAVLVAEVVSEPNA